VSKGYNFVLVKGFTTDNHYEHIDPGSLVLVPVKELPTDPGKKDVYAPIGSEILHQWANEKDSRSYFVYLFNYFFLSLIDLQKLSPETERERNCFNK
jgi:hypothetical protein